MKPRETFSEIFHQDKSKTTVQRFDKHRQLNLRNVWDDVVSHRHQAGSHYFEQQGPVHDSVYLAMHYDANGHLDKIYEELHDKGNIQPVAMQIPTYHDPRVSQVGQAHRPQPQQVNRVQQSHIPGARVKMEIPSHSESIEKGGDELPDILALLLDDQDQVEKLPDVKHDNNRVGNEPHDVHHLDSGDHDDQGGSQHQEKHHVDSGHHDKVGNEPQDVHHLDSGDHDDKGGSQHQVKHHVDFGEHDKGGNEHQEKQHVDSGALGEKPKLSSFRQGHSSARFSSFRPAGTTANFAPKGRVGWNHGQFYNQRVRHHSASVSHNHQHHGGASHADRGHHSASDGHKAQTHHREVSSHAEKGGHSASDKSHGDNGKHSASVAAHDSKTHHRGVSSHAEKGRHSDHHQHEKVGVTSHADHSASVAQDSQTHHEGGWMDRIAHFLASDVNGRLPHERHHHNDHHNHHNHHGDHRHHGDGQNHHHDNDGHENHHSNHHSSHHSNHHSNHHNHHHDNHHHGGFHFW